MNNKLYVGNLPYKATEDELKQHFAPAGTVISARIITEGPGGRSKGFGFVEMETGEMAQKAIETLSGVEFNGRALNVAEAKPPRETDRKPREMESGREE